MADDKANLDNFLGKVDHIESLIKGLVNSDEQCMEKADQFLEQHQKEEEKKVKKFPKRDNTGVNRTVINKDAYKEPEAAPASQDDFMRIVEEDAKERTERKRISVKEANAIKDIANEHFKNAEYEQALTLYTQAISIVKDMTVLYTNRAQTYIKLGRYEEALTDCDWALRVFENCLKAYIHQGRANLALKKFDEAEESFKKAMTIEPSKEKAIQGYLNDVDLARRSAKEEEEAQQKLRNGDIEAKGVVEVLQRITKKDQLAVYYSGGLRILSSLMIANADDRTLFRTNGGIKLAETHTLLSKCLAANPRSIARDEMDMCFSFVEALTASTTDNEENQVQILSMEHFPSQLLRYLESQVKHGAAMRAEIIRLLLSISQSNNGRSKLVQAVDMSKLLNIIFDMLKTKSKLSDNAVSLMNNLAMNSRFRKNIRDVVQDGILPAFESLLTDSSSSLSIVSLSITTMTNLCADLNIRKTFAQRKQCWEACSQLISQHFDKVKSESSSDIVHAVLGLIMNMTYEQCTPQAIDASPDICSNITRILQSSMTSDLQLRCCSTLGHLLQHSAEAVSQCVELNIVPLLIDLSKQEDLTKPCAQAMVACTQHNKKALMAVCALPNGLSQLLHMLDSSNDGIVGNAALCLSHCAAVKSVCASLVQSDIIKQLLVLARDQNRQAVRHNCAILTAKLCQGHPGHLERLRELHGIEILHDVIRYDKQ